MTDYLTVDVGDVLRLQTEIEKLGVDTDPSTLALAIRYPNGGGTSYTYAGGDVTKGTTGVYYYDLAVNQAGTWRYGWTSVGSADAYESRLFYARRQPV